MAEHDPSNSARKFFDLLRCKGVELTPEEKNDAQLFIAQEKQSFIIRGMIQYEEELMSGWNRRRRHIEIDLQSWNIPNATVDTEYRAGLDVKSLKIEDLLIEKIEGLDNTGLSWNANTQLISGIPTIAGTIELSVKYALKEDSHKQSPVFYSKKLHFVVNPNPRTLWKNIPSDREAPFWKEDDYMSSSPIGDNNFVACSKRGRSHQHKGTFRDDHYDFQHFTENSWSVVAVSDGAGSAKYSREGSKIACKAIIDFYRSLSESLEENALSQLDKMLTSQREFPVAETLSEIENFAKSKVLYPAAVHAHETLKNNIRKFAADQPELFTSNAIGQQLNDFHATLIFCLFKEYDFGTVLLTFGVGDCPIAITYHDQQGKLDVSLLNKLDVGEYGGGTRFITQPRIFEQKAEIPMVQRLGMNIFPDFLYLFLMTDGIYDPKFEVEANLEKPEHWLKFISDLGGENEDQTVVELIQDNQDIESQLSKWMDFFSKGNHDDRTLAVIF